MEQYDLISNFLAIIMHGLEVFGDMDQELNKVLEHLKEGKCVNCKKSCDIQKVDIVLQQYAHVLKTVKHKFEEYFILRGILKPKSIDTITGKEYSRPSIYG